MGCLYDMQLMQGTATRDSKSEEMLVLNRAFSRAHAMSIHLNLITIGATLWYGWQLASKLQF